MEKDIINKIDNISNNKNLSNILFYGPFLHGKEDICDYLIKSIYKTNENIVKYVLNINCLSINGIKNIKEYIKLFSMQILNKTDTIKFKTIILKNAEYLTYDSQYSLRRTIEHYNKTTRFILICDNKYKILNPEGLRLEKEFVKHKTLDCIGDFYLLGMQLIGNISCFAPGHSLNQKLIKEILKNKENYTIEDIIPENNNENFIELIDRNNASRNITCVA